MELKATISIENNSKNTRKIYNKRSTIKRQYISASRYKITGHCYQFINAGERSRNPYRSLFK